MIHNLEYNQIFVFGSNLAGRHGRGAALQAMKQFGAEYGVGEGMTGQCYALPTLDGMLMKRQHADLLESVTRFLLYADAHREYTFLLTKVGCGLAGYDEDYMRSFFVMIPTNVIPPEDWDED